MNTQLCTNLNYASIAKGLGLALGLFCLTAPKANANDLMQVYRQALQNDPRFRSAQYQPKIVYQDTRKAALAAALPQVGFKYSYGLTDTRQPGRPGPGGQFSPSLSYDYQSLAYSINIDQVLFDYRVFSGFAEAERAQDVADQALEMTRTQTILQAVEYYFQQLVANADLKLARAELEALAVQLQSAKLRLDLGADSKLSVQQIQARHYQAKAQLIIAENNFLNVRNQLWAVTLEHYPHLASAQDKPPAHHYQPNEVEHWVRLAFASNAEVLQATASTGQAYQQRKRINANYWPRINLSYQYGHQNIIGTDQFEALFSEGANSRISVVLDFPLFTGGGNIAKSRSAAYQYQASRENEQYVRRKIENEVVQLWNNHQALRSALEAREAVLLSTTTALDLTRQGKLLGTNSTSDLLESVKDHYQAQRDFVSSIYDYLFNQVRFEAAAGSLNAETVMRINSYLKP